MNLRAKMQLTNKLLNPKLEPHPPIPPVTDEVRLLIEHMALHPKTCIFGFRMVKEVVASTAAWYADVCERDGRDWQVIVTGGYWRDILRMHGEIAARTTFNRRISTRTAIGGNFGRVHAVAAESRGLQGRLGNDILWIVEDRFPLEMWPIIDSSVAGDVKVLALNPEMEVFGSFSLFNFGG